MHAADPTIHTLRLAHSPDSDDLVMWWPLTGMRDPDGSPVKGPLGTPRVTSDRFAVETVGEDVQALNAMVDAESRDGDPTPFDATAISAATYPCVADRWAITRCGGSFGEGYGPRVVVRTDSPVRTLDDLRGARIAVPGTGTSAFLALSMMLGDSDRDGPGHRGFEHEAVLFSDVPGRVLDGHADAGLLIHEAQLTFADMGLREVANLGEWWAANQPRRSDGEDALPLPLGLNVIRRDLDDRFGQASCVEVSALLSASVRYATEHLDESKAYLRLHSEGRPEWNDDALVERYLGMYVSRLSVEMGDRGERALRVFLGLGAERGFVPPCDAITVL
jgi:1,4-dihydroxy-6-naphthoate synthase